MQATEKYENFLWNIIRSNSSGIQAGQTGVYIHIFSFPLPACQGFIANLGKIKVKGIYKSIFFCLELLLSFGEKKKKKGKGGREGEKGQEGREKPKFNKNIIRNA